MNLPLVKSLGALVAGTLITCTPVQAIQVVNPKPPVDLVLALDVSGSMNGLLESAKQRLWDVVNDMGRAQPQPDLRVALMTYGSPKYGRATGYVRVDVPLTRDLDAINEALFALTTRGGDEYVARVLSTAMKSLAWSQDRRALRTIFVAGNEAATQDPMLDVHAVAREAKARDIVVNTIFCGQAAGDLSFGWAAVATGAGGVFASIDQQAASVANVATPYDKKLALLNDKLNRTYVPYGAKGHSRQRNQVRQDANAGQMSAAASASRAVTKASSAYRAAEWDLVDAVKGGVSLESIEEEQLPEAMQEMSREARTDYVTTQSKARAAVQQQIQQLGNERREYILDERAKAGRKSDEGLSAALKDGLRKAAQAKGFVFNN
ncbi:MAG: VWA domain-containing protein [Chromatiales bacterium]|nr:VWA domain-containing protein [Chromatiales bacterium]